LHGIDSNNVSDYFLEGKIRLAATVSTEES